MNTLITSILLGISLSMDAFSLSIFLGTIISKKNCKVLIISIGIMHLIMPLLGAVLGVKINNYLNINESLVLGIILIILSIQIIVSIFSKETKKDLNALSILVIATSVSIDSFSVGFGLIFEKVNILMSAIVFSLCSMTFTLIGLLIGKYYEKKLGIYSKIVGATLLLGYGIYTICY